MVAVVLEVPKAKMAVLVVETLAINQPQFQAELQTKDMLVDKVGLMAQVVEAVVGP